jgi:hypothetical protein
MPPHIPTVDLQLPGLLVRDEAFEAETGLDSGVNLI